MPLTRWEDLDDDLERRVLGLTPPMRVLERLLAGLERISGGYQLERPVRNLHREDESIRRNIDLRYRAARRLDFYIFGWVIAEVALLVAAHHLPSEVLVTAAVYRLVEISQVFANSVLFDRRRSMQRGVQVYLVLSIARSIVHSVVLLLETIFCFALLFFAARSHIDHLHTPLDALDVSFRTLTTVGSAATAHGAVRLLVDIEPLIGLLFAGAVLARLLNAAPPFHDDVEQLECLEDLDGRDIAAELRSDVSRQVSAQE